MNHAKLILLGALASAAPAVAKPIQFSAIATGELGYGTNPFLRRGVTKAAPLASGTVAPKLSYDTSLSSTTLTGVYTRDEYLSTYGKTDSLSATLTRADQLRSNLASTLAASYSTSNRAILTDPTDTLAQDALNIGRRTRRINGNAQLRWQATGLDQFSFGANGSHLSYGRRSGSLPGRASGYDQYGANASYFRLLDARTSIGAQITATKVQSSLYPNSRSIQPSLTAKRQLSAIWSLDGHVGLVFQTIEGPFGSSRSSIGFGLNLCGTYPRTTMCLSADRGSQPSGFGGLRTSTFVAVTGSHKLTEHDRISVNARYEKSESVAPTLAAATSIRNARAVLANAQFDHDFTERLSGGVGARYQWRDLTSVGTARSVSATIHVTAKLGRI